VLKSGRIRWARNVACMIVMRIAYHISVEIYELDSRSSGQDIARWQFLLNMIMEHHMSKGGKCLHWLIFFSRRILLHGVM
jgi:hypothetical protein